MFRLEGEELQRIRWRQGQMLLSADFREQVQVDAELAAWHNRALHQAYGVVSGFAVWFESRAGELAVIVDPGLAYDCYGRPLILSAATHIDLPDDGDELVLLVRYRAQSACSCRSECGEMCIGSLGAPPEAGVELIWKRAAMFDVRDGVPLTRTVAVPLVAGEDAQALRRLPPRVGAPADGGRLIALGPLSRRDLVSARQMEVGALRTALLALIARSRDLTGTRAARALARPLVGSGVTLAGQTPWAPWEVEVGVRLDAQGGQLVRVPIPIGFQVRVDTSGAGFIQRPYYFAGLQGPFFVQDQTGSFVGAHWDHIEDTAFDHFTFRTVVVLQQVVEGALERRLERRSLQADFALLQRAWRQTLRQLQERRFFVSWLGVEPDVTRPSAASDSEVDRGRIG